MKKGKLTFLLLVFVVIAVVIVIFERKQHAISSENRNPFELNYDEFKEVDSSMIGYKEIRRLKIPGSKPRAILMKDELLYLASGKKIYLISLMGQLMQTWDVSESPNALAWFNNQLVVGFQHYFVLLDNKGKVVIRGEDLGQGSHITSLAAKGDQIVVADAGNRKVFWFNKKGEIEFATEGKRSPDDLHGFIIPSPYFDIAFDPDGKLWIVNPGKHAFEQYDDAGNYKANWSNSSFKIDGFSGCCNPAQMAIMADGSFLTSEKGLVRVKIYSPSGKLKTVVAGPADFKDSGHAPEVVFDSRGIIYALDFDRNQIRVFKETDR